LVGLDQFEHEGLPVPDHVQGGGGAALEGAQREELVTGPKREQEAGVGMRLGGDERGFESGDGTGEADGRQPVGGHGDADHLVRIQGEALDAVGVVGDCEAGEA
jgi:hypothetical protein